MENRQECKDLLSNYQNNASGGLILMHTTLLEE